MFVFFFFCKGGLLGEIKCFVFKLIVIVCLWKGCEFCLSVIISGFFVVFGLLMCLVICFKLVSFLGNVVLICKFLNNN